MRNLLGSSGVRGTAMEEITPDLCFKSGLAISSMSRGVYAVGHDVRYTSPLLAAAFECGLRAGGSDTIVLGLVPTPALAFLSRGLSGGVMITASHNPPQYNGFKLFDSSGASWRPPDYRRLAELAVSSPKYAKWDETGSSNARSGTWKYLEWISSRRALGRSWNVGLDPGNGSTSMTASLAFKSAGCGVKAINSHPDPLFKGRGSEPSASALSSLSELVRSKGLEIGFAYDGDGDRFAVVDEDGRYLEQDAALAFAASMMVKRGRKDVVVNVDTSISVDLLVEKEGGKVHRAPVGDVYVLESLLKLGASFGGETCGAWIFPDESLCPDGVLSSLLFLSMLEEAGLAPSEVRRLVPPLYTARKSVPCSGTDKGALMRSIYDSAPGHFQGASVEETDGIRVVLGDRSWVLIRASGTEPTIRVTAESEDGAVAHRLVESAAALIIERIGELRRKE
ncbi:MAG: hypothetical protein QFX35_03585 [Candidatus Verstraetearchaeota archaeon]|nr:hypothetical protein [Candidatus Verstraetearchaeota archaeon]